MRRFVSSTSTRLKTSRRKATVEISALHRVQVSLPQLARYGLCGLAVRAVLGAAPPLRRGMISLEVLYKFSSCSLPEAAVTLVLQPAAAPMGLFYGLALVRSGRFAERLEPELGLVVGLHFMGLYSAAPGKMGASRRRSSSLECLISHSAALAATSRRAQHCDRGPGWSTKPDPPLREFQWQYLRRHSGAHPAANGRAGAPG